MSNVYGFREDKSRAEVISKDDDITVVVISGISLSPGGSTERSASIDPSIAYEIGMNPQNWTVSTKVVANVSATTSRQEKKWYTDGTIKTDFQFGLDLVNNVGTFVVTIENGSEDNFVSATAYCTFIRVG